MRPPGRIDMAITPEKFARMFLALHIPLTEEEFWGLERLFEKLCPGITACLEIGAAPED